MSGIVVVLAGGPGGLPASVRVREVDNLADKVKIPFASGYEHFVHEGEVREMDGRRMPVFQWCDRTRVAE